jgi:dihydropteroate synthase
MGIVNVTPDSFSDGGQFLECDAAVRHAVQLVAEGADILDIGGESTRPNALPLEEREELRRVLPVIESLRGQVQIPLSIDTMKPVVARAALAAGASVVNDVAANREDETMWRVVADAQAGYVALHMQGTPQTMQQHPAYQDVVAEVETFLGDRLQRLTRAGVAVEQTILDPGIGFGKTTQHNLQLLASLDRLKKWNRPVLLGASRKAFIQQIAGDTAASERMPGSIACACWAVQHGVNIIRTHDVGATRQAVRVTEAILARRCSGTNDMVQ